MEMTGQVSDERSDFPTCPDRLARKRIRRLRALPPLMSLASARDISYLRPPVGHPHLW